MLLLLGGYVLARAALGALVNPPFNGPDEWGHWEHVASWSTSGGQRVTGVEAQQPRAYYALASVPFQATLGAPLPERLFAVRLLSAGAGLVACLAVWLAARWIWPARPLLAVAAAALATLAPGHLFLLASINNDPLAEALAAIALLAAVRLSLEPGASLGPAGRWTPSAILQGPHTGPVVPLAGPVAPAPRRRAPGACWWVVWGLAAAGAVATKLSAAPAMAGAALALLLQNREAIAGRLGRSLSLALGGGMALVALGVNAALLARHPSTSGWASIAHFWPLALARGPLVYLPGGLVESFRTYWYAYDYAVRFPRPLEVVLAGLGLAICLGALLGLALGAGPAQRLPLVVWGAAAVQIVLVIGRLGFADVLDIDMGGAAQAKAFFPALPALALLATAGLAGSAERLTAGRGADRWLAVGTVALLLTLDWASLAVTLWHHYRWWQVGL